MAFLRRRERKSTAGLNTLLNRIQKKNWIGENVGGVKDVKKNQRPRHRKDDKIFKINGEGLKHSLRRAEAVIFLLHQSFFSHLIQSRLIRRYFTQNYPKTYPA